MAAHAGGVDLLVEFGDGRVQVFDGFAGCGGVVALLLDIGAEADQPPLIVIGFIGDDGGFVVQVPALAALGHPQMPIPLGTRRTLARQGRPTRHIDDLGFAGRGIDALERDGPDAHPVLDGDGLDHITGQRLRHPNRTRGSAVCRCGHAASPGSGTHLAVWPHSRHSTRPRTGQGGDAARRRTRAALPARAAAWGPVTGGEPHGQTEHGRPA
jgi:hypothetical protein